MNLIMSLITNYQKADVTLTNFCEYIARFHHAATLEVWYIEDFEGELELSITVEVDYDESLYSSPFKTYTYGEDELVELYEGYLAKGVH